MLNISAMLGLGTRPPRGYSQQEVDCSHKDLAEGVELSSRGTDTRGISYKYLLPLATKRSPSFLCFLLLLFWFTELPTMRTGSKLGKEYVKAVCCHLAYSTYMQSTSYEMPGWMKHKLESRLVGRNINNLRYADDTTLIQKAKRN